jgi:ribose transport system permease protein
VTEDAAPVTQRLFRALLRNTSVVLLVAVAVVLAAVSPRFRELGTYGQILTQTSSLAIVATGMTFVLLAAGIDLSVGAVAFLGAAILGKLILSPSPVSIELGIAAMLGVGILWGGAIGFLVTRFSVAPFVVTLAALFIGRGMGLAITETRAMNLPASFRELASGTILGVPPPAFVALIVVVTGEIVLRTTVFGRHVLAVGEDATKAAKAGLPVGRIRFQVHAICGFCAALGGVVSLAELGAVSPKFGEGDEFRAIAACVLGGTSLFGGRGSILLGAFVGALLLQSIRTGLNVLNVDPYVYPVVTSVTIFLAVWIDSAREKGFWGRRS